MVVVCKEAAVRRLLEVNARAELLKRAKDKGILNFILCWRSSVYPNRLMALEAVGSDGSMVLVVPLLIERYVEGTGSPGACSGRTYEFSK